MSILSNSARNRLGFAILGLTNNFSYVIMLAAAYDLLGQPSNQQLVEDFTENSSTAPQTLNITQPNYCNDQSTSTILLADTLPSLMIKVIYSFALVGIYPALKASGAAFFSALSYLFTGLSSDKALIFTGVICASLSTGLGECTYLSHTPRYGQVSLSGWSMGTGLAGLVGSASYAALRVIFSVKVIMNMMLVVPIAMLIAYFYIIVPIDDCETESKSVLPRVLLREVPVTLDAILGGSQDFAQQTRPITFDRARSQSFIIVSGGVRIVTDTDKSPSLLEFKGNKPQQEPFNLKAKLKYLPKLSIYFLPMILVFYSEYFINQGLFELIYYPEVTFLDKAAQYRWFQVSYQLGVMISRSTLDFFQIKNIWAMSLLQAANALLFFIHAAKLIYLPNFYFVIALIVYEGLLGGFTYVNAFYRIRKEVPPDRLEFSTSAVLVGDSLGIVGAGLTALPVHKTLCKLYQ